MFWQGKITFTKAVHGWGNIDSKISVRWTILWTCSLIKILLHNHSILTKHMPRPRGDVSRRHNLPDSFPILNELNEDILFIPWVHQLQNFSNTTGSSRLATPVGPSAQVVGVDFNPINSCKSLSQFGLSVEVRVDLPRVANFARIEYLNQKVSAPRTTRDLEKCISSGRVLYCTSIIGSCHTSHRLRNGSLVTCHSQMNGRLNNTKNRGKSWNCQKKICQRIQKKFEWQH